MKLKILTTLIIANLIATIIVACVAFGAEPTPTPIPTPVGGLPPMLSPTDLWVIMIPPITDGYEVLSSVPFGEWQEADSYHGAYACQAALPTFSANYVTQLIFRQGSITMEQLAAVQQQTQHAVCIARSDPRLTR